MKTHPPEPGSSQEKDAPSRGRLYGILFVALLIFTGLVTYTIFVTFPDARNERTLSLASEQAGYLENLGYGIHAYFQDHQRYPLPEVDGRIQPIPPGGVGATGFLPKALSTPVVYISRLAMDPFTRSDGGRGSLGEIYRYATVPDRFFMVLSLGPDGDLDMPEDFLETLGQVPADPDQLFSHRGGSLVVYDPSNGAISSGDLIHLRH